VAAAVTDGTVIRLAEKPLRNMMRECLEQYSSPMTASIVERYSENLATEVTLSVYEED
jgi:hypothetical protein